VGLCENPQRERIDLRGRLETTAPGAKTTSPPEAKQRLAHQAPGGIVATREKDVKG
jgi:hypothetical protein